MAPELINAMTEEEYFSRTRESDVYSFAFVCMEVRSSSFKQLKLKVALSQIYLDGNDPWTHLALPTTSNVQPPVRPLRPARMDEGMWRLVNGCWEEEREKRPEIQVVVETLK
jgi:hypothetical protein